jgi:two-component system KDP operon response regulator KdpE
VILDLMLPDMSGMEVCRELCTWLAAPILVLSVRAGEADKVQALDEGADDHLTKPFSARELLARIRALLRRAATRYETPPVIETGDLTVDIARRSVTVGGRAVSLTPTEFDILALLARNADCVVTQKAILEEIWGPEWAEDRQTLRAHVSNLRRKLERRPGGRRYVLTEPGVGFRLSAAEPDDEAASSQLRRRTRIVMATKLMTMAPIYRRSAHIILTSVGCAGPHVQGRPRCAQTA